MISRQRLVISGLLLKSIFEYANKGRTSGGSGRAVTTKGRAATARRAAAALKLEPRQTEALVYIYEHKSITFDDFKQLYPDTDKPLLEDDLQALVKLGLMVPQGDKFVMT